MRHSGAGQALLACRAQNSVAHASPNIEENASIIWRRGWELFKPGILPPALAATSTAGEFDNTKGAGQSIELLRKRTFKPGHRTLAERQSERLTFSSAEPATVTVARFRVGRFLRGRAKFPTGGDGPRGLSPRSPRKLHHA